MQFSSTEQAQAENFRKMLLAMARDVRVMLIKLADRLHNMRTLDAVDPEKRRRIARETLEIYAPIAHRLGLNALFRELEELSFEHLHPMRYRVLHKAVLSARAAIAANCWARSCSPVRKALSEAKIRAEVYGREKTLYGIYRKMAEKNLSFSQVLDIYGFRIVVDTRPECYLALGALHELFKPVPGKFKDYIAIPKVNGYQSLHTTLIGPYGTPVEFQIRTKDMHHVAETGVAAHWLYKDDDSDLSELQSRTHQWLQSLLEIQRQTGDSSEFLEHIKVDLFPDKVYVFTPKGKIVSLPRGATVVDFAYSIHTDVGNKCVAARINGEIQPLRTPLRNGDMVEIVTGPVARPNPAWLSFVRTGKARSEIRHFLRTMKFDESVELGERLLSQAARQFNLSLAEVTEAQWETVLKQAELESRNDLLADIGLGRRLAAVVARQLALGAAPESSDEDSSAPRAAPPRRTRRCSSAGPRAWRCSSPTAAIRSRAIPSSAISARARDSRCTRPTACTRSARAAPTPSAGSSCSGRTTPTANFTVGLDVGALNERGVLGRIAVAIAEGDSNILNVHVEDEDARVALIHFKIQVRDRVHLARVIRSLQAREAGGPDRAAARRHARQSGRFVAHLEDFQRLDADRRPAASPCRPRAP